ncbi:ATP-binding protein [Rhodococcus sp. ACT016]|uniref:ATP-binding protein n=1 Tax=Rhodococcus sp. ACT016 TaxID=3134808 RepID=UPI003D2688AE
MAARNPFTPSFGVTPPLLVGRGDAIADFDDALDAGPGAFGRAALVTGQRGTGKTVLLNQLEDQARTRGWLVIAETATPGLIERLATDHLPRLLAEYDPDNVRRRVTGLSAGPVSATSTVDDQHKPRPTLRSQLEQLTSLLARHDTGVLITVDEVHAGHVDELRELFTTYQHAVREGQDVAIVAAGLPASVSDLLSDSVLTFLRRAHRIDLGSVADPDVAAALRVPIESAGRSIDDDALTIATAAVRGYPFLIQLVGDLAWRTNREAATVTAADAAAAAQNAPRRMGQMIYEPALRGLSAVDRTYLAAMAVDDGPSRTSVIADRMSVTPGYASMYRQRLIDAELVRATGRGYVDFTLPYLREYLRDHAVTELLDV